MAQSATLVPDLTHDFVCTGGGKTECYRMLQNALTMLHQQAPEEAAFQAVHTSCLNPKSISMSELYGNYNQVSNGDSEVQPRHNLVCPPVTLPCEIAIVVVRLFKTRMQH